MLDSVESIENPKDSVNRAYDISISARDLDVLLHVAP
jgi:hypothetical protein